MLELDRPRNLDEIYLARGAEVDPLRPLIQGDIFRRVTIPGVGVTHRDAMVIEHPCSMRKGPAFKPRLQMVPVIPHDQVPLEQQGKGHFRVFLLPELDSSQPDQWFAASFDEIGMVPVETLKVSPRIGCLSERGILLLQQRQIFSQARTKVETSTLREYQAHVFEEVELQEDWNRALVPIRVVAGETLLDALDTEAAEFDAFLGVVGPNGESLRQLLRAEHQRASVRRQVRREIATRAESHEFSDEDASWDPGQVSTTRGAEPAADE